MSTDVEVGHFKPKIDVGVVHFTLDLRVILLFSGACNNNELVTEPHCRVSVSWMLHGVSLDKVVAIVSLDLVEAVKRLFVFLVVTSSDKVQLSCWTIDALEVVRELMLVFHFHLLAALVQEIDLVNHS
jgi:hypothetical protein